MICFGPVTQVHMPKTGGSALASALRRLYGKGRYTGIQHDGGFMLQEGFRAPVVVATRRDPQYWYDSLYRHALGKRDHLLTKWGGGSIQFKSVLYGWTHPTPDRIPRVWPGVVFPDYRRTPIEGSLYEWADAYFHDQNVTHVISTERMSEDLSAALGVEVEVPMVNARSGRMDWDDEMLSWL